MTTRPITGETWGDEIDGPRAFILSQAQKPFAELLPPFESAMQALRSELQGVSEAQAAFKPGRGDGEDDYSIAEVTRHMINVIPMIGERISSLGTGRDPLPAQGPGSLGVNEDAPLSTLTGLLETSRQTLLDAVASVDGKEQLEKTMPHRLFGELNCRGWLAMQALHAEDHARQVGKIKAHASYPKA